MVPSGVSFESEDQFLMIVVYHFYPLLQGDRFNVHNNSLLE
jgi:hypothetical protein